MSNKHSKSFLDKVFQLSPNPIAVINADDATYVEVNDAFTKYFGLKRKEIIGRTSLELGLITAKEMLAYRKQMKETGDAQNVAVKIKSKKNGTSYMLCNTKRIKVDGHSYDLTIGTDLSTMDFVRKARQFDQIIESLEAVKEVGVIFISNYEKKNPSVFYATKEAQDILKIYPLKTILKMIQGQDSIFLKKLAFIYYVRNLPCPASSPLKIIFMRRLMDATCMTQKLKEFDLTFRERQIAVMVAYGHSNIDIAKNLCISPFTVKDHVKSIFKIIGVHKRSELFLKLLTLG
jgi:PAS domain S-box-containing protein